MAMGEMLRFAQHDSLEAGDHPAKTAATGAGTRTD
jgi:hypothetical protein